MVSLPLKSFDAAIFDMDGTMVDNKDYHLKAWQIFLKRHGRKMTTAEFNKRLAGKRNAQILEDLFEGRLTEAEVKSYAFEKEKIYRELYIKDVEEVPGLSNLFRVLKNNNKKVAVATNSPKENVEFIFEVLDLKDFFDVAVWDEHVEKGKPNPDVFIHTADKLLSPTDRCIVFEDSSTGVKAGKAAGMKVVAVLTGHTKDDLKGSDYYIHDFNEVQLL